MESTMYSCPPTGTVFTCDRENSLEADDYHFCCFVTYIGTTVRKIDSVNYYITFSVLLLRHIDA